MMSFSTYLPYLGLIIGILISLFILHRILKSPRPLWNAVKSSIVGVVVLLILSSTSRLTEVYIPLSLINIGISSIAGIPGVFMLVVLNMIFSH